MSHRIESESSISHLFIVAVVRSLGENFNFSGLQTEGQREANAHFARGEKQTLSPHKNNGKLSAGLELWCIHCGHYVDF